MQQRTHLIAERDALLQQLRAHPMQGQQVLLLPHS
jgi:hypothetical protein